mmetsp:Transcript_38781/g.84652  ORF Transcript_38781/g.84652 Transcript_38781/m.84652 type:complete len:246 (+) Transcript_38781:324-1061(+)
MNSGANARGCHGACVPQRRHTGTSTAVLRKPRGLPARIYTQRKNRKELSVPSTDSDRLVPERHMPVCRSREKWTRPTRVPPNVRSNHSRRLLPVGPAKPDPKSHRVPCRDHGSRDQLPSKVRLLDLCQPLLRRIPGPRVGHCDRQHLKDLQGCQHDQLILPCPGAEHNLQQQRLPERQRHQHFNPPKFRRRMEIRREILAQASLKQDDVVHSHNTADTCRPSQVRFKKPPLWKLRQRLRVAVGYP